MWRCRDFSTSGLEMTCEQRKIHNIINPTEEPALATWETELAFKLMKDHPVR
jgi:hypothetical protein